jgi:hypothetical protein
MQVKLEQIKDIAVAVEEERKIVRRAEAFKFTEEMLQGYAER